jgi:hypothetical protein
MKLNRLSLTILAAAIVATAYTTSPVSAAELCGCRQPAAMHCPRTVEYWKWHLDHTQVLSLRLGNEVYSRAELKQLLAMRACGDQSIVLAKQLVATKLNRKMGCEASRISQVCAHADSLLKRTGRLPYRILFPRRIALAMAQDAAGLEAFNEGLLTPGCTK